MTTSGLSLRAKRSNPIGLANSMRIFRFARNDRIVEISIWLLGITVFFYALRPLLFFSQSTLFHDNFYWNYPVFHFFAVNLIQGALPLWDPYTSGGQPFYPLLGQFRLLEPIAILTVVFGKFFTLNTAILFHWTRILETLWMGLGTYLLLRPFAKMLVVRLLLIPLLLFSSFALGSFRQDGIISQFLWAPWVLILLKRIFFQGKRSLGNWLALGFTIGINFQSYFFVGVILLVSVFFVYLLVFERTRLKVFQGQLRSAFLCFLVILAMAAPNLVLISQSSQFSFPLRMVPSDYKERLLEQSGLLPAEAKFNDIELGIGMKYEALPYSGAFVKIWEWLQIVHPSANPNIFLSNGLKKFGNPSEAYLYFGLGVWWVTLLGFFYGRGERKKFWAFHTLSFFLFMLGPPGGLHHILYSIFPPLWFLRHTDLLVLYFELGFLYFFVLGMHTLLERGLPKIRKREWLITLVLTVWFSFLYLMMSKLEYPIFKFPETNFLFVGLLLISITIFYLWRYRNQNSLWASLLFAHLISVFILSPQKNGLLLYWAFFLILPLGSWILLSRERALTIFSFCLCLDLGFSFSAAKVLYDGMPNPSLIFGGNLLPKPIGLHPIDVQPQVPLYFKGHQSPRYLSLLFQSPYALSASLFGEKQNLSEAVTAPRWNSYLLLKSYHQMSVNPEWVQKAFRLHRDPIAWYRDFPQLRSDSFEFSKPFQIERNTANYFLANVTMPEKGFFYWADGFDPSWVAEVDGESVPVSRALENFKAIPLSKGTHQVEFQYRPWGFLIALLLFYCVPVLLFGYWGLSSQFTSNRVKLKKMGLCLT